MATDERPDTAPAVQPSDTSRWITAELLAETIRVWEPRYGRSLSTVEAKQIILAVSWLGEVLKS